MMKRTVAAVLLCLALTAAAPVAIADIDMPSAIPARILSRSAFNELCGFGDKIETPEAACLQCPIYERISQYFRSAHICFSLRKYFVRNS